MPAAFLSFGAAVTAFAGSQRARARRKKVGGGPFLATTRAAARGGGAGEATLVRQRRRSEQQASAESHHQEIGRLEKKLLVEDVFASFVSMRCGAFDPSLVAEDGRPPHIFWHCTGELREQPSGNVLANVEGWDVAIAVQVTEDKVVQLSRKIFFFLDPLTGQEMTEYRGRAVKPIKYDYQVIEYVRGPNGSITPSVVQGLGDQRRVVPCMPITNQAMGKDLRVFQAPLFIDTEIPGRGHYQAWEIYDFLVDSSGERPANLTWVRQGMTPPFSDEGSGTVMHLVGSRLTSFEQLPDSARELIKCPADDGVNYSLFCAPPADFEEVRRLQQ